MKKLAFLFSVLLAAPLFSQPAFKDLSSQAGFNAVARNSGIAIADYDNDGFDDVYVAVGNGANLLYHNLQNGTFEEVAAQALVADASNSIAAAWADIDNDGWTDLYVGNAEQPNRLYRNLGNGRFEERSAAAGVDNEGRSQVVLFADVDLDGWIDMYVANINTENALYRNNGDGTFTDIVETSGTTDRLVAMGSLFFVYDNDGDPDLYLTHDNRKEFILYQNDGKGRFTNVAAAAGVDYAGFGMGVDVGDVNRDGWLDLYITNLYENVLFLNKGDGSFENISATAGIDDLGMGWGTAWMDCDNDGWQDIYAANDSYFPVDGAYYDNVLYQNNGDNTFTKVSDSTVLSSPFAGYGVACSDFDNDGREDIFLANKQEDGNQLFHNLTANEYNWVQFRCVGTMSNRSAIGTRVTLALGDVTLVDEISGGSGFASQNSQRLHFGLGAATTIDRLSIRWPSGLVEERSNVAVNQLHTLVEGEQTTSLETLVANDEFRLQQLQPNPFRDHIACLLELEQTTKLQLDVVDLKGQLVAKVFEGRLSEGMHTFQWDGRSQTGEKQSSGLYLLIISANGKKRTYKLILEGQ
ncbi:MAG: FG-GAP-like repeat-containing protein [Bacteroidota bacterium]